MEEECDFDRIYEGFIFDFFTSTRFTSNYHATVLYLEGKFCNFMYKYVYQFCFDYCSFYFLNTLKFPRIDSVQILSKNFKLY